jgi:intracellular septation protein A
VSQSVVIAVLLLVSVVLANLPFLSQRLFGFLALPLEKSVWIRLAELCTLYFLTGAIGMLLEHRAGQIARQTWEFYAITGALFVTLAFPGFIYRYLLKHPGEPTPSGG